MPLIKELAFGRSDTSTEDNILDYTYLENGDRITVVDRMTGYQGGIRDTESAYTEKDGDFFLATGNFDVRIECADMTTEEAKAEIKSRSFRHK